MAGSGLAPLELLAWVIGSVVISIGLFIVIDSAGRYDK
jgi:hypothetical protein